MSDIKFEQRKTIEQVEESTELAPKFDRDGLIPVVTTDFESGEVLMQGYMNEEAFKKTISLGEAVYYSRSRKTLWHKGKTSGLVQKIKEIRIDDDQDCVWLRVDVQGGASCHVALSSTIRQLLTTVIIFEQPPLPRVFLLAPVDLARSELCLQRTCVQIVVVMHAFACQEAGSVRGCHRHSHWHAQRRGGGRSR